MGMAYPTTASETSSFIVYTFCEPGTAGYSDYSNWSSPPAEPQKRFRGRLYFLSDWWEQIRLASVVEPVLEITLKRWVLVKRLFNIQQPRWSRLRWRSKT